MSEIVETRIGKLPREWQVRPLAETTIKIQDGTHFSPRSTEGPCRYLTSKNIRFGRLDLTDCGWITQKEHDAIYSRCDVKHGDVLLTKDGANTGNACLNTEQEPFSLLSSVAILRTDGVTHHSGFILQYLLSPLGQRRLKDLMSGNAITRLTLQKIKAFETPWPSGREQHRIVEILSTLDEMIEQTEALIAKYEQIKVGLMHDLFTRGVTPEGHLRPTSAQAPHLYKESSLALIPKHWEVRPFQRVLKGGLQNGYFKRPELVGTGYKLINVSELYQQFGIDTDHPDVERVQASGTEYQKYAVEEGDLFFTRSSLVLSGIARCNAVLEVREPTLFECHVIRGRPDKAFVNPDYLGLYFHTIPVRRDLMSRAKQVTMTTISQPDIVDIPVSLPPLREQVMIAERVEAMMTATRGEEDQLRKLRQQKHGLMHDLLTGRVRVSVPER